MHQSLQVSRLVQVHRTEDDRLPLAATKAVVDVDVEAEEVEVGDVVEAPAVAACGASGAFRMSPPPEEDEGGEGGG